MDSNQRLREVANLRFAFQSKSRMRLEFLGELSKILRVHGQAIPDELLASVVVAIPEELPGEGFASVYNTTGLEAVTKVERPPQGPKPPRPPRPPRPPKKGKPSKTKYFSDATPPNVPDVQQMLSNETIADGMTHTT